MGRLGLKGRTGDRPRRAVKRRAGVMLRLPTLCWRAIESHKRKLSQVSSTVRFLFLKIAMVPRCRTDLRTDGAVDPIRDICHFDPDGASRYRQVDRFQETFGELWVNSRMCSFVYAYSSTWEWNSFHCLRQFSGCDEIPWTGCCINSTNVFLIAPEAGNPPSEQ